jgi:hypothetical protein
LVAYLRGYGAGLVAQARKLVEQDYEAKVNDREIRPANSHLFRMTHRCDKLQYAMLIAYLDESYDQEMKEVFVAAGFIARYEWSGVEWRWKALLEKYELKYYRAAEAGHAREEFEKPPFRTHPNKLRKEQWTLLQEVRNEFLLVLCNGRLFGLAIGIHMKDFHRVACTPEILDKFGNTRTTYVATWL